MPDISQSVTDWDACYQGVRSLGSLGEKQRTVSLNFFVCLCVCVVIGNSNWDTGHWGNSSASNTLIVLTQTQWTRVQRLSPKNKGGLPYIPLQTGYRSKKKSSTHIWLHVTLLAISPPHTQPNYMTFFVFQFFKLCLCYAIPSPCYNFRTQTCLFLFWFSSLLQCKKVSCLYWKVEQIIKIWIPEFVFSTLRCCLMADMIRPELQALCICGWGDFASHCTNVMYVCMCMCVYMNILTYRLYSSIAKSTKINELCSNWSMDSYKNLLNSQNSQKTKNLNI
jgi:hypothetical protein